MTRALERKNFMKTQSTISAVVLFIGLAGGFVLYMLSETSQTAVPWRSAEHQQEVAELKRQIAVLQARVNWLTERFTESERQKPSQF
jgi:predicted PurR-regulated permease PerM